MSKSQLIPLPAVEIADVPSRAQQVIQLAQAAHIAGGRAKLTLGSCLKEIRDNKYWELGSAEYKSFEQFAYQVFGYAHSTVSSLIQVYSLFIEDYERNPDDIQAIGWAKLAMLTTIVSEDNVDELLRIAADSTQAELRKYIKGLQGKHITQTSDGDDKTKFSFTVPTEQAEVVKSALELSEEVNDTEIPGMALEAMAADYLISHQSDTADDHLDQVIATIERVHNITITYTRNDVNSN